MKNERKLRRAVGRYTSIRTRWIGRHGEQQQGSLQGGEEDRGWGEQGMGTRVHYTTGVTGVDERVTLQGRALKGQGSYYR